MKSKQKNLTPLVMMLATGNTINGSSKDNQKELALEKPEGDLRADSTSWTNVFDAEQELIGSILDCEVDEIFADHCITGFENWYYERGNLDRTTLEDTFTEAVAFKGKELKNWLKKVGGLKKKAEVRVCFGLYTEEALDYAVKNNYISHSEQGRLGLRSSRLTVILRAYRDDCLVLVPKTKKPMPAYNLGSLKP